MISIICAMENTCQKSSTWWDFGRQHSNINAFHCNAWQLLKSANSGYWRRDSQAGERTLWVGNTGRQQWNFHICGKKISSKSWKRNGSQAENCALASLNLGFHSGSANDKSRLWVCLIEYQCPLLLPEVYLSLHKKSVRKGCRDHFWGDICHVLIICKTNSLGAIWTSPSVSLTGLTQEESSILDRFSPF